MKKNIAFVALDSSLVRWMLEQLQKSKIAAPSAQELSEGLRDLMDGTAGSLMLELGEGEKKSNSRCAERMRSAIAFCFAAEMESGRTRQSTPAPVRIGKERKNEMERKIEVGKEISSS
ncbi:hypothetical protein [Faecalibacterium sp. An192]|uniref:hypothetical protein n=1 Tax=Faecalibacterium sp. An192 TaxID=1965581 RepID=UPI000B37ACBD|nr:hypothetical protein [Faecalibacterium sp. An192]OUP30066.1 hypothetical protein B5F27_01435 [Faecalibacterium sp. An192]